MMKKVLMLGVVGVFAFSCMASGARADDTVAKEDKRMFKKLLTQRNNAHQRYQNALEDAKKQVKKDGQINFSVQDIILKLRQEKDRIETRLLTIALRHGWDVSDFSNTKAVKDAKNNVEELERVFGSAKNLVNAEFKKEAIKFAAALELPVQKVGPEALLSKER